MNGCHRFALQARSKFIDQVRILAKSKILWNHGRILLCPGYGEELYSTFGVDTELLRDSIWTEPGCNVRGLKRPDSIQHGMLEFNPKTVQTTTIAKFCSMYDGTEPEIRYPGVGFGQPENISEFLQRMKVDQKFRSYYYGLYDSLRLLYRRIYYEFPVKIIQAEKHWSSKLDQFLKEEQGALECYKDEITARRARVAWLEQIKADELIDRNLWRSGLVPLPVWRRKVKKHVAKRKGNNPAPATDKKRKVDEASLEKSSP